MSMSSTSKPAVFILGATGATGTSVVNGLLESGKYTVIVGTRLTSLSKPEILKFRERGLEVRGVDLDGPAEALDATLKGVDIVLSCLSAFQVRKQYTLIDAAKRVGVKRFVPDDWSPAGKRGVRRLNDEKADVQDYIKSIGLPYTFIDCGLWQVLFDHTNRASRKLLDYRVELYLPLDKEESQDIFLPSYSHKITSTGDVKNAIIYIPDIGKFVVEILGDHRTLNKYVFCWTQEKTQNEIWDVARKAKAEVSNEPLKARPGHKTVEEVKAEREAAAAGSFKQVGEDYLLSMFVLGDNTIENAKKGEYGGALDGKELYPDLKLSSVEEVAKMMYSVKEEKSGHLDALDESRQLSKSDRPAS